MLIMADKKKAELEYKVMVPSAIGFFDLASRGCWNLHIHPMTAIAEVAKGNFQWTMQTLEF